MALRRLMTAVACAALMVLGSGGAVAQVRTIDPNQAVDSDLDGPQTNTQQQPPRESYPDGPDAGYPDTPPAVPAPAQTQAPPPATDANGRTPAQDGRATATTQADATFKRDDLIGAGEDVFGKGAEGFASIIERILREQGEPNAYIAGREASGAFVVGLRYGSGIMTHKIEGQMPVYWTGPSVGFDLGGDANKVFVLVYNLYDSAELYKRFPAAEGRLYFVGGFAATYLRRGNVVLIPVRLGVGWRAGVNVGYMNFTQKSKWLPF